MLNQTELSERELIIKRASRKWRKAQWKRVASMDDHGRAWREWLDEHYPFDRYDCLYVFGKYSRLHLRHLKLQRHWLRQIPRRQLELEQLF